VAFGLQLVLVCLAMFAFWGGLAWWATKQDNNEGNQ
jgi:hypothetical protein